MPMHLAPSRAGNTGSGGYSKEFTDWEIEQQVGTGDIVEETKKAFERGEWFGAFARLHCIIEFWMQEIYEFDSKRNQTTPPDYLTKHYFYGYWRLVEDVRKLGYITDDEARRFVEFGRTRSRIFHRLIKHYPTGPSHSVQRDEVVKGFEEGLALESMIRERLEKLMTTQ